MSITFFDVETPNRRNDRICSIGIVQTDNSGTIIRSESFLVNPDARFDESNMSVHGISPIMVERAKTFDELWKLSICPMFDGTLVSAHNASFDLSVLAKTLTNYGIDMPSFEYACTMRMAKTANVASPTYSLPDVCAALGIRMGKHHDALDDANACKSVFWRLAKTIDAGKQFSPYVKPDPCTSRPNQSSVSRAMADLYGTLVGVSIDGSITENETTALSEWMDRNADLGSDRSLWFAFSVIEDVLNDGSVSEEERRILFGMAREFVKESGFRRETVAMQELLGILRGISSDGEINLREAQNLIDWIDDHEEIASEACLRPVFSIVSESLEDGVITATEHAAILGAINDLLDPQRGTAVEFEGKKFVLSGDFIHGSKSDVERHIVSQGGEVVKTVSKKCRYVVVGDGGSEKYAFGNYGTKAKKALELKSGGANVDVVRESDIYSD